MSTVPKITIEQAKIICANPANADLWMANQNQMIEAYNKALAEQQESEYITAAQARELVDSGGEAEYFAPDANYWVTCRNLERFPTKFPDFTPIKYRAIKQSQPEPVDSHAELRAEYIRQRDAVPCELRFYLWEVLEGDTWKKRHNINNFYSNLQYRYTDISCYVSKDGEPAIRMLRTEAQELQRNLGDTVEWVWAANIGTKKEYACSSRRDMEYAAGGTYTYRTKATIKLGGNMVTPEQAAAEWDVKKETHDVWYQDDNNSEMLIENPIFNLTTSTEYNPEYQIRQKALKQPTWTGSREDVIALLKENELL